MQLIKAVSKEKEKGISQLGYFISYGDFKALFSDDFMTLVRVLHYLP